MAIEFRTEHGRWVKQDGFSEVGQQVDESMDVTPGADDRCMVGRAQADPSDFEPLCLICEKPAITKAMVNSWRSHTGEENMFVMRVCPGHRGQWWYIPDEMQYAWDAATQRSLN